MRRIHSGPDVSAATVTLFVAAIFSLLPISTDFYLPSLPVLKADFGATDALAQLTLSAFIAGFALAQLAYGPLSDRHGRRPVLLAGITVYVLAGIACMLAPSVEVLAAARLLQGAGACSGMVMARAIIRDLYEPARGALVLSHMTQIFSLIPMFGPLIGGFLTIWFGWRANFAVLTLFGVLVFAMTWLLLDETNRRPEAAATDVRRLAANARIICTNRDFIGYTLAITFSYCGLFAYLSASSFVLQDVFDVPTEHFGLWFMLGVVGNLSGATACSRLSKHRPLHELLRLGASFTAAGGLLMLVFSLAGMAHPLAVMGPMALFLFGHGFNTPVCFAAAVGPFPGMAGTASALLGVVQLSAAAAAGQAVLRLFDGSSMPLAVAVAASGLAVLGVSASVVRKHP